MRTVLLFFFAFGPVLLFAQEADRLAQVHIIHGSRAKYKYQQTEYKMLGGMYGGHVVMQLDSHVYGFLFTHYRLHVFPSKKHSIGMFEDDAAAGWHASVTEDKVTTISIPITQRQFEYMDSAYKSYLKDCPYDYSFFGMRCAASCLKMLCDAGVLEPITQGQSVRKAFYPRPLRKDLVDLAKLKGWQVTITEGSPRRKWEKDYR
jgi:hypothetical protein